MIRIKLFFLLLAFELFSWVILGFAPRNEAYYIIAGLFSFAIIPAIATLGSMQIVLDVLLLAVLGLITQFIGLLIYYLSFPVSIYNHLIEILLAAQFIRLLIVTEDDGISRDSSFLYLLCRPNFKRDSDIC